MEKCYLCGLKENKFWLKVSSKEKIAQILQIFGFDLPLFCFCVKLLCPVPLVSSY
jgi:serine kinase of HPr protein (carbohydrate metabolism regulator)